MSSGERSLKEDLARYMDPIAFVAKRVGRERTKKYAVRREIAKQKADAALRFLSKPEQLERLLRNIATKENQSVG